MTPIGAAPGPVTAALWSDGTLLAGITDGSIADVERNRTLARSPSAPVVMVADRGVLAWMDGDGGIWALDRSAELRRLDQLPEASGALAFGPDGALYTGTNAGEVRTYDTSVEGPSRIFDLPHTDKVTSVAVVGTNERWLLTASEDETLRVTRYASGESIGAPLRAPKSSRFTQGAPLGHVGLVTRTLRGEMIVWRIDADRAIDLACEIRTPAGDELDVLANNMCDRGAASHTGDDA